MKDLLTIMKNIRLHLMGGVSYMIPFVVAGGILLAGSVALYGQPGVPPEGTFLNDLFNIGAAGFTLMVPILAGFIAYSIADRGGIAPGAIAGLVASDIGAGFLGGIVAGIVAGIVVYYLKKIKVPKVMKSVMPIFVIPIVGTFVTAGLMKWAIGTPISHAMNAMTSWLEGMGTGNQILLGVIIGLMMAFDMGGPVNKVAFAFGVGTVSAGIYTVAGPMAVAICTPPIGMAIATLIAPKKYTPEERESGKAAFLMGCIGITEGAIPFAAADPLKVIPSLMAGGAVGTALAMVFGVENHVGWGGLIVIPVVSNIVGFIISILVGSVVTALIVNFLKKPVEVRLEEEDSDDIELTFE
jgi:fructose-specific PTS system IIC-like component